MSDQTDWEQCYVNGETPWDQGAPSPVLVDYLEANEVTGNVAVPGCGSGHDVIEIARRTEQVTVLGLDLSQSAVALANGRLAAFQNATVRAADIFDLDPSLHGQFDWIWEHTCYCAIDPKQRSDYVTAVDRLLKPGGKLLAVFYLDPKGREDGLIGPPFGTSTAELDERFEARFSVERSEIPDVAYPGREGRELMRVLRKKPG